MGWGCGARRESWGGYYVEGNIRLGLARPHTFSLENREMENEGRYTGQHSAIEKSRAFECRAQEWKCGHFHQGEENVGCLKSEELCRAPLLWSR
jgi:hypothetical protein